MFDQLKGKYLGIVANDAAQLASNATKRMFEEALGQQDAQSPNQAQPAAALPLQQRQETPTQPAAVTTPGTAAPTAPALTPYLPPSTDNNRIEEDKLRSMARWKASVNLKYVETITRFARDIIGSMAATDSMVDLVERLERNDTSLSPEDLAIAEGMKKAVEQRRKVEQTKSVILSDAEMRTIYEEIIFQEMREQNRRGELQLQSEREFFWNLTLITLAEIGGAGKEAIAEKVTGAYQKVTKKLR